MITIQSDPPEYHSRNSRIAALDIQNNYSSWVFLAFKLNMNVSISHYTCPVFKTWVHCSIRCMCAGMFYFTDIVKMTGAWKSKICSIFRKRQYYSQQ